MFSAGAKQTVSVNSGNGKNNIYIYIYIQTVNFNEKHVLWKEESLLFIGRC